MSARPEQQRRCIRELYTALGSIRNILLGQEEGKEKTSGGAGGESGAHMSHEMGYGERG